MRVSVGEGVIAWWTSTIFKGDCEPFEQPDIVAVVLAYGLISCAVGVARVDRDLGVRTMNQTWLHIRRMMTV
jgi:hypothetical protein